MKGFQSGQNDGDRFHSLSSESTTSLAATFVCCKVFHCAVGLFPAKCCSMVRQKRSFFSRNRPPFVEMLAKIRVGHPIILSVALTPLERDSDCSISEEKWRV
ncbi:hypothetical protein KCP78_23180 [Salmonella enterica subsp. enterica]|nr:hypothetical protein KCP78_23180 [Salmonella enterica subsp. enterica]